MSPQSLSATRTSGDGLLSGPSSRMITMSESSLPSTTCPSWFLNLTRFPSRSLALILPPCGAWRAWRRGASHCMTGADTRRARPRAHSLDSAARDRGHKRDANLFVGRLAVGAGRCVQQCLVPHKIAMPVWLRTLASRTLELARRLIGGPTLVRTSCVSDRRSDRRRTGAAGEGNTLEAVGVILATSVAPATCCLAISVSEQFWRHRGGVAYCQPVPLLPEHRSHRLSAEAC